MSTNAPRCASIINYAKRLLPCSFRLDRGAGAGGGPGRRASGMAIRLAALDATNPPCTCRAQGRDFLVGEKVCLRTAGGDRLATCGMALNNTSWSIGNSPCTVSALQSH